MTALRPQDRGGAASSRHTSPATAGAIAGPRQDASAATIALVGGGYGAVVFGGAVSLLHLLHNRVGGVRDALVMWIFFALLAGLAAAGAAVFGLLVHRVVARDRNRGRSGPERNALAGPLVWGLTLFHLAIFVPLALYGRTYDEVPFFSPRTAAAMIAVLATAGLLIAVAVAALSRTIGLRLAALSARGSLRRASWAALAATAAIHVAAPIVFALGGGGTTPAGSSFRPLRAEERTTNRVVLLGLDGADWRVLGPMVERGEAPAFGRLMKEGAWGPLATLRDQNSAVLWASIYTGKRPRQHGVLDFYRIRVPGMSGPGIFPVHRTFFVQAADELAVRGLLSRRIADRSFLRTRPLWEILDDLGSSVGVVDGYHFSVPARPLATEPGFFFSYALNALSERPDFRPDALSPADHAVLFEPPEAIRFYAPHARLGDFHWQAATLLDALAAQPQPDFVNLYTHQPDLVQHQRWKWFEPARFLAVDPADVERFADAIPEVYRAFDRFVGTLIGRLEPGTTLIVVSDHGHSPTLVDRMYTQHRHGPPGIVLLWGDSVRRGVELEDARILDVTPTVLHLLGLPVAADMAGRVLLEALAPPLGQAPVRTIESYDAFGAAQFEGSVGPDLSAEEIERLRALGYL